MKCAKCKDGCKEVVVDYDKMYESSYKLEINDRLFLIAAEDIVCANGKRFWSFADACEISERIFKASGGWRLPTDLEMKLIAGYIAWQWGGDYALEEELKLCKNGFGNVCDDSTSGCTSYEPGETGLYWTSSPKVWPEENIYKDESGIALKLKHGTYDILPISANETTASMRLVKVILK